MVELSSYNRNLKYLPSGPSQKMLADPWPNVYNLPNLEKMDRGV